MRLPRHTPATAAGNAADPLGDIIECHGSARAMVRIVAGSAFTRTTHKAVGTAEGQD